MCGLRFHFHDTGYDVVDPSFKKVKLLQSILKKKFEVTCKYIQSVGKINTFGLLWDRKAKKTKQCVSEIHQSQEKQPQSVRGEAADKRLTAVC